jgi:anti-anti-sigma factor
MPQTVFEIETSDGVLIVTPRGDAVGFREADVNHGVNSVLEQIAGLTPPLVVVDLGSSGYFGSVIIGALAAFAERARDAGGAFAVCHVSDQMRGVLKVMRLDQSWRICDTRPQAIQAVQNAVP